LRESELKATLVAFGALGLDADGQLANGVLPSGPKNARRRVLTTSRQCSQIKRKEKQTFIINNLETTTSSETASKQLLEWKITTLTKIDSRIQQTFFNTSLMLAPRKYPTGAQIIITYS